MAKKIKNSDLFDKNLFVKTSEDANKLLHTISELKAGFKDLLGTSKQFVSGVKLGDSKDINQLNKAIADNEKLRKQLAQLGKVEESVNEKKKKLTAEEIAQNNILKKQEKEAIKAAEDEIILQSKTIGSLEKYNAQLRILRRERAGLNIETKEGKKRTEEINAEIDKLNETIVESSDKFKQQRMNVGNYKDSVKEALKETSIFGRTSAFLGEGLGKLKAIFGGSTATIKLYVLQFKEKRAETLAGAAGNGLYAQSLARVRVASLATAASVKILGAAIKGLGLGLLIAAISAVTVAFTKTQKGADDISVVMRGLEEVMSVVIGRIADLGFGLVHLFSGVFVKTQIGIKQLQKAWLEFKELFTFGDANTKKIQDEIKGINKEISELSKDKSLTNGLNEIAGAFTGIGDAVSEAYGKGAELGRLIVKFREENLKLREELMTTDTQLAVANQKAGDATLSFQKRLEEQQNAAELQIKVSGARVKIAQNNAEIARKNLEFAQENGLKDIALREKLLDELEKVDSAESEFELAKLNRDKQGREIRLKGLELELKVIEKQFDKLSTRTEKEINDVNKTIAARQALLAQIAKESESIYLDEISRINRATDANINANDLINESDAGVLANKIRALGLGEQAETALNKAITQRQKQLIQESDSAYKLNIDLEKNVEAVKKIQGEITQIELEGQLIQLDKLAKKQEELLADTTGLNQLRLITEEINKIYEQQFELKKKAIEKGAEEEIRAANDTIVEENLKAKEIEKINKKLANDLAKLEDEKQDKAKQTADKEKELAEKRKAEQIKDIQDVTGKTFDAINERLDARKQALDEEIAQRADNIKRQENLAEKGLDNQLAFEEQKQKENELRKKDLAEREIRLKKVEAYITAFTEYLKSDPDSAPFKALAQVTIANTIAGAFKDGVENLNGKGTETSDSNLVLLSKGESVLTAKATKENKGLATALNKGKADEFILEKYLPKFGIADDKPSYGRISGDTMATLSQLSMINKRLQSLEKTIEYKKENYISWDSHGNMIASEVAGGVARTIKYVKQKPRL